jgi:hypothetical protein
MPDGKHRTVRNVGPGIAADGDDSGRGTDGLGVSEQECSGGGYCHPIERPNATLEEFAGGVYKPCKVLIPKIFEG